MPTAPLPWGRILLLALVLLSAPQFTLRLSAQVIPAAADTITRFLENRGQVVDMDHHARPDILFTASAPGVRQYLRRTGISYVFYTVEYDTTLPRTPDPRDIRMSAEEKELRGDMGDLAQGVVRGRRIDMDLIGANPNAVVERSGASSDRVNYYLPQCPDGITGLASYTTVTYLEIYPSIDLVLHGTATGMKYDFVVHPGGDVAQIRMRYTGAEGLEGTSEGGVEVTSTLGNLVEGRPYSYQIERERGSSGERKVEVVSGYRLVGSDITFQIGAYDRRRTLVVDPVMIWGTFYGGSGMEDLLRTATGNIEQGKRLVVDATRSVLIVGGTYSTDFPLSAGAFQTNLIGMHDAYLLSFNRDGTRRWATIMGGNNTDIAGGVGVDSTGNITVSVTTYSTDFPVTAGAFRTTYAGGITDGAIIRFDSSGVRRWGTYFGSTGRDHVGGVAVDRRGSIIVAGYTDGPDCPVTAGAFQSTSSGSNDLFISKFDSSGGRLWSTYYGGQYDDWGDEIAVDFNGNIAVAGTTNSGNFPVSLGAFRTTFAGGDAFLLLFDSLGNRKWCTFVGGSGQDEGLGVAFDAAGNAYVAGTTTSGNFPTTARAIQRTIGGSNDLFFSKFSPTGGLTWSTYYGGRSYEYLYDISMGYNGDFYFIGNSTGTDALKTSNNFQDSNRGAYDVIFGKVDSSGSLVWDSYYGGSKDENWCSISSDIYGHIYISGVTTSSDLSTRNAYQDSLDRSSAVVGNHRDAFIAKFCDGYFPTPVVDRPTSFCDGDSVNIHAPLGYFKYTWTPFNQTTRTIIARTSGVYSVTAEDTLECYGISVGIPVVVHQLPRPTLQRIGDSVICQGDSVIYRVRYPASRGYLWTTGSTADEIVVTQPGTYSVQVTDSNGCVGNSASERVIVNPLPKRPKLSPVDTIWLCPDSTRVLDAGVGYVRTVWSNGIKTQRITAGPGRYWVRVYNEFGCSIVSDTVVVKAYPRSQPLITVLGYRFICPGDSVVLDAGPGYRSYKWSNGNTGRYGVARTEAVYTVLVTDSNGCLATSPGVLIKLFAKAVPTIEVQGTRELCQGDSVILDAGLGRFASYRWSTGETSAVIFVSKPGNYFVSVTSWDNCIGGSDTVQIRLHPRPKAIINGPTSACFGSRQIYFVSPEPDVSYQWTISGDGTPQGRTDSSAVVVRWGTVGPGEVRLRATNRLTGCTTTVTVPVSLGTTLVPTITSLGTSVCPGDSMQLDAGDGYVSYLWSNGATTRTVTTRAGATWTVTVRNADGCQGTSLPVLITESKSPTPVILPRGSTTICISDSVELDAGAGYSSYLWSTGDRVRSIFGRVGGLYTVTVTDTNGCKGTSPEVAVREGEVLHPIVTPIGSTTFCDGDSVVLDAGVGWSGYLWSSGDTGRYLKVTRAGSYAVRVTDARGCFGTSIPVVVFVKEGYVPDINGPLEVCRNSEVTYQVTDHPGSVYQWTVVGGTILSGNGTSQIVVTWGVVGIGSVQCEERVTTSGCVGVSPTMNITIGTQLRPTISPGGSLGFCLGDSVVLDAGVGYVSYLWNTGATSRRIVVRTAGTYSVMVADAGGCSGSSSDVVVREFATPTPTLRALGPTAIQQGDSVGLEVVENFVGYQWTSGDTTQRIWVRMSGDYHVTVVDSNGCMKTSLVGMRVTVVPRRNADTVIANVVVGTASGSPGERVMIPLQWSTTNLDTTYVKGYRAELRFNRSLLLPTGATPTGIVDGSDRVITFNGTLPSGTTTGGDLTHLEFIALLGNAESTPLRLTSFELVGAPVAATITDGEFRLTGHCRNGGTRLANSDGSFGLKSVRPNPTNGICEVEYEIVESGMTRVYVVDLFGRRVAELQSGAIDPGRYVVGFDAIVLGSGTYSIILETPTQRRGGVLQVVR
jgi:hypothetical protein